MGQLGPTVTAVPPSADGTTAATRPALIFRAGPLLCALWLDEVIETMRPLPVHPLAGTPPFVGGLTVMRGRPAPVVEAATLLAGTAAPATRFIAIRTPGGPVALATGPVVDVRPGLAVAADTPDAGGAALLGTAHRLVAAVGTSDGEPLLVLRSPRLVPDQVWAAIAAGDTAEQP